jgi:hypothetical protein
MSRRRGWWRDPRHRAWLAILIPCVIQLMIAVYLSLRGH